MRRLLVFAVLICLFAGCQSRPEVQEVDTNQLYKVLSDEVPQIVDVRSTEEFNQGRLPDSWNIPINTATFEKSMLKFKKDEAIMVYCAAGTKGSRSEQAAQFLIRNGYEKVYLLRGGYRAWSESVKNGIVTE